MTSSVEMGMANFKHPHGESMCLSESIVRYLKCRPDPSRPFYVGQWLRGIGEDELSALEVLCKDTRRGEANRATDDLIGVSLIAMAAEMRCRTDALDKNKVMAWIDALDLATALERYRREGLLVLESDPSIRGSQKVKLHLTERGRWVADAASTPSGILH